MKPIKPKSKSIIPKSPGLYWARIAQGVIILEVVGKSPFLRVAREHFAPREKSHFIETQITDVIAWGEKIEIPENI